MNRIADVDKRLASEDEPSADSLRVTLSMADTLEEDRERYQDVISRLIEFEAAEGENETVSIVEEVHDLDANPEITLT